MKIVNLIISLEKDLKIDLGSSGLADFPFFSSVFCLCCSLREFPDVNIISISDYILVRMVCNILL